MAKITSRVTIKRAWWVMPYLNSVMWFAEMTGLEPDMEKIVATAMRGYRISIK